MPELQVSAVLYPLQSVLVVTVNQPNQPERNGMLSNGTGFLAVTFPAGFSAPTAEAQLGVPLGAELLGLDYTEDSFWPMPMLTIKQPSPAVHL